MTIRETADRVVESLDADDQYHAARDLESLVENYDKLLFCLKEMTPEEYGCARGLHVFTTDRGCRYCQSAERARETIAAAEALRS